MTSSQETILPNAKCITLIYMAYFFSLTFILDLREDLSLNKTWSLDFSPSLFHKYTATSAKHNKYEA